MTTQLCATPYDMDAGFFYFDDAAEFADKQSKHINRYGQKVEEYELQFIDGSQADAQLFEACGINQANLQLWEDIVSLDDYLKPSLFYACDVVGWTAGEALEIMAGDYRFEEFPVYEGGVREYAEELLESTGELEQVPEHLRYYFNMDAFARDLEQGGSVYAFEFDGKTYTCAH
jgi:hypothetical protein